MKIKELLPSSIRLNLRIAQQKFRDIVSGNDALFAGNKSTAEAFLHSIVLSQPIKQSKHFENKVHNINRA